MKILLLLSGYTCKRVSWGKGDDGTPIENNMNDFFSGHRYIKKLLRDHKVKSICGLWDDLGIKEVKQFYKPEICISLDQNKFQNNLKPIFGNYENERIKKRNAWLSSRNVKNNLVISAARFASQLYGRQVVIKRALDFLNESSYEPDLIFLTRYDISCRGGVFIKNPAYIDKSIERFLKLNYERPKAVLPLFNQLNVGLPDMWFYLNLKGLESLQYIYDEYVRCISSEKSQYKSLLTSGWPYSEWFNLADTNDKRQFTNLIYSGKKSKELMRYKDWELPNIHAFHKYFMLLSKNKFDIKYVERYKSIYSMINYSNLLSSVPSALKELISGIKSKIKKFIKIK